MPLAAWLVLVSHEILFTGKEQMYYVCSNIRYSFFALPCWSNTSINQSFSVTYKQTSLPPATKLGQGNIFRSVCQQFCPQGGRHAWLLGGWGGCVVAPGGMCGFIWGGMHGFILGGMCGFIWGACVVLFGEHAWFYLGGMCGFIPGGVVLFGGMRGFIQGGHVWFFQFFGYNEIRSMSGRYASYWNAFLLIKVLLCISLQNIFHNTSISLNKECWSSYEI